MNTSSYVIKNIGYVIYHRARKVNLEGLVFSENNRMCRFINKDGTLSEKKYYLF